MSHRLITAPWWVLALVFGAFFGVSMAAFGRLAHLDAYGGGPGGLVIQALVTGVPFGVIMGRLTARGNRRATEATGLTDPRELVAASRATTRGPAPTDPHLREATRSLAVYRLGQLEARWVSSLTVFALAVVGYIAAAIFLSPWWAVGAVAFAAVLVNYVYLRGRLERRIAQLSS